MKVTKKKRRKVRCKKMTTFIKVTGVQNFVKSLVRTSLGPKFCSLFLSPLFILYAVDPEERPV